MALANGYLRFQQPQDQDPLAELLKRQAPPLPGPVPMRPQMPQRPRQSAWEVLPQLLAGVGDVVGAGAGIRTNYLPQTMGMQEGRRNQAFHDQLNAAAMAWDAQKMGHEDNWRRYAAYQGQDDRDWRRAVQMKEFGLMDKLAEGTNKQGEMGRAVFKATVDSDFSPAETMEQLEQIASAKLKETGGDPFLMQEVEAAKRRQLAKLINKDKQRSGVGKWLEDLIYLRSDPKPVPWHGVPGSMYKDTMRKVWGP